MDTVEKNTSNTFFDTLKSSFSILRERMALSPLTKMRLYRFRQIKRARISFWIITVLYLVSLVAELFINNRPLIMRVDGKTYFPTYGKVLYAKDFGFQYADELELDYRHFKDHLKETGRGWLWMPVVPYNPYETDSAKAPLAINNANCPVLALGLNKADKVPTDERGEYLFVDVAEIDGIPMPNSPAAEKRYIWVKYADSAKPSRISDFGSKQRTFIGLAFDKKSKMESDNPEDYLWFKSGQSDGFSLPDGSYLWIRFAKTTKGDMFHPLPPSLKTKHFLGTDRIGRDILARLFYGYRICMSFSLLYVSITYVIGITIGILMGYIGGIFDILFQRFIEIWEQIPFLYVVMILASIFKPNFLIFLAIYVVFGWSGKTWTARAMTYRERERDYVLAARSMGASMMRIVMVHILPNIMVIVVTSLPFAISGGISSLTGLDFLGYGLRPPTPSWGELLSVGVATFKEASWILTASVSGFVIVLILITFIGEGLREAFDPKRYTVYK